MLMIGSDFSFQHWMIDKPPELNVAKYDIHFQNHAEFNCNWWWS